MHIQVHFSYDIKGLGMIQLHYIINKVPLALLGVLVEAILSVSETKCFLQ